jgi:hypothetical protein
MSDVVPESQLLLARNFTNVENVENACTVICENERVAGDVKHLGVLHCLDENKV